MHLVSVVRSHGNLKEFKPWEFMFSYKQANNNVLPIAVLKLLSLSTSCLFNNFSYNNLHVVLMKCFRDLILQHLQIIFGSFPLFSLIIVGERHYLLDCRRPIKLRIFYIYKCLFFYFFTMHTFTAQLLYLSSYWFKLN